MTPAPNFEVMSFESFAVHEHFTTTLELDPETNFLKLFFPLIDSKHFTVNKTKKDICK